jgi:hypothetical protein
MLQRKNHNHHHARFAAPALTVGIEMGVVILPASSGIIGTAADTTNALTSVPVLPVGVRISDIMLPVRYFRRCQRNQYPHARFSCVNCGFCYWGYCNFCGWRYCTAASVPSRPTHLWALSASQFATGGIVESATGDIARTASEANALIISRYVGT